MGCAIGIDLGTTTSEVAYIKNGRAEIIQNSLGERITPSAVGITDDGEYIVGTLAKRQYTLKPEATIIEIKRLMGTSQTVKMNGKFYTPEEISAILLGYIKEYAESYLGEEVDEVVITVPANFNDLQRQATKKAGELAGLKVGRIINEPTAAALAYGITNLEADEKVLIYDLGGGTFDVTVLELFDGILDVQSSRGNNEIGGKDFDQCIEAYILRNFEKEHHIDLRKNPKALARIKEAAEVAKKELSIVQTTNIELPFIAMNEVGEPLEISISLTRSCFEELIDDLLRATEVQIDEALDAAGYSVEDIDVVIAVGGSSRVPAVQSLLKRKFVNKVKSNVNPDEAVAIGAAIQAGIKNDQMGKENDVLITDTCNYTLGISIVGEIGGQLIANIFDPLIKKDTKIPTSTTKVYYTATDRQTVVNIEVFQGDNIFALDNVKIDEVELSGIPEDLAGQQAIEVKFEYDIDGTFQVSGKILSTGSAVTRTIKEGKRINNTQTNDKRDSDLLERWKEYPLAYKIQGIVNLAENKVRDQDPSIKAKIMEVVTALKKAVIEDNEDLIEVLDDELTDQLFELN